MADIFFLEMECGDTFFQGLESCRKKPIRKIVKFELKLRLKLKLKLEIKLRIGLSFS